MRNRDELRAGCAEMLKDLRLEMGLSKSKMAEKMFMDHHTWTKYETGQSAPSAPDFIWIFSMCHKDALRAVLDYLYPEVFESLSQNSTVSELRNAASHYFERTASERELRIWEYLCFGDHGSNLQAQLNMLCMIDHLPMTYRVAVAQMIDTMYELAENRGELLHTDQVMPNIEQFRSALEKGRESAHAHIESYNASLK